MNEDLLNVTRSFSETALDCIEKQNEEIKQLEQENQQLKEENKKYKHVIEEIEKICASVPKDWSICGVEKIYKIEQAIAEVNK